MTIYRSRWLSALLVDWPTVKLGGLGEMQSVVDVHVGRRDRAAGVAVSRLWVTLAIGAVVRLVVRVRDKGAVEPAVRRTVRPRVVRRPVRSRVVRRKVQVDRVW